MALLESAPLLKAEYLEAGYRVLADFNGVVLAGKETLLGAQFATWAWGYDRKGLNNGHYYREDYQGAKEDFALRAGLVTRERPGAAGGAATGGAGLPLWKGPRLLPAGVPMPAPPGSDHSPAAGKNPGSDAERKSEAWTVHMRAVPNQAPLFSIQKLLVSLGLRHFFRYVW
jgi:hypothetical protein